MPLVIVTPEIELLQMIFAANTTFVGKDGSLQSSLEKASIDDEPRTGYVKIAFPDNEFKNENDEMVVPCFWEPCDSPELSVVDDGQIFYVSQEKIEAIQNATGDRLNFALTTYKNKCGARIYSHDTQFKLAIESLMEAGFSIRHYDDNNQVELLK